MICLICRTRLLVYDVREYYCIQQNPICLPHHETFESLIQSIEAGCFICNRLWATLGSGERNSAGKPMPLSRRRTIEIFSPGSCPLRRHATSHTNSNTPTLPRLLPLLYRHCVFTKDVEAGPPVIYTRRRRSELGCFVFSASQPRYATSVNWVSSLRVCRRSPIAQSGIMNRRLIFAKERMTTRHLWCCQMTPSPMFPYLLQRAGLQNAPRHICSVRT